MKFEGTKVTGFENAIIGMRLPMSYNYKDAAIKVDSKFYADGSFLEVGPSDLKIMKNLIKADNQEGKAGQPNSKFLRMIHVQTAITAPIYLYKELSTYKIATTYNSTSTMHKLASTPITIDCFEMDDFEGENLQVEIKHDGGGERENAAYPFISAYWSSLIDALESLRCEYNKTKDKRYWKELIRILPESWLQTRMFDCNYATLQNIYKWRSNHKLSEWHTFCDWIRTLPLADELIIGE